MLEYVASNHSLERATERCRLNRNSAERTIKLAYKKGKKSNCFNSYEKEYLLNKEERYGNTTIVYGNFCYIFADNGVCVTVLPLPTWFNRKRYFYHKEKVRNIKKFIRNVCYI